MIATVYKISEELFEDSFELIALHCDMECYSVAYQINKFAQVQLERAKNDLEINACAFPLYEYKDDVKGEEWYLITNKVREEVKDNNTGFFQNETTVKINHLLEERKEIDYLLKLYPETDAALQHTVTSLRNIPTVRLAYQINADQLKSKGNLIF